MTVNKLVAQEFAYFKKEYEKKRDDLFRSFYRSILLACGISFELTYQEIENGKRINFADQHFSRFMNSAAVQQFVTKTAVSKKVFKEFDQYARMKSFTMMGDVDDKYLKLVQAKMSKIYAEGKTEKSKEFRKALSKELDNYGSHYMRLVYQNNIEAAAQATRYQTAMEYKDQVWGFEYYNPSDERSREDHAAMNGKMFPMDHSVWKTWYPPNGHLCRCSVQIITHAMAKAFGFKHSKSWPKRKGKRVQPDKGWKGIEDFGKAVDFKKVVEVRKAVEKTETLKKSQELAAKLKETTDIESIDLDALPEEAAVEILETLTDLHGRFKSNMKSLDLDETEYRVYASVTGKVKMSLNEKFFGNPSNFNESYQRTISSFYHPALKNGLSGAKAVVTHEFAHTLVTEIDVKGVKNLFSGLAEYKRIAGIKKAYVRKLNNLRKAGKSLDGIRISRYAQKNISEFIAESFAMVETSPVVSPFAKKVYDIIMKELGR